MYFHHWGYVLTRQKQGGKVIVEQRHDGTVTFHEGWLKASEAGKAWKVRAAGEAAHAAGTLPEISDDIGLHRHAAAQASLIRNPAIALRLMPGISTGAAELSPARVCPPLPIPAMFRPACAGSRPAWTQALQISTSLLAPRLQVRSRT